MLTNLTNLTRSATQTLLTNGTRSLALVVDVNMKQARASRSRHVSILHVGPFSPAGIYLAPIDPERIRIDRPDAIPGSPRCGRWLASGQSQSPSAWSACQPPSGVRRGVRDVVTRRRVVPVGPVAGSPVTRRASASTARAVATARAHAPAEALAVSKRPAAMGG